MIWLLVLVVVGLALYFLARRAMRERTDSLLFPLMYYLYTKTKLGLLYHERGLQKAKARFGNAGHSELTDWAQNGKFFECKPEDALSSFDRLLKEFPLGSLIWSGHEYSKDNLEYALEADPDNDVIKTKLGEVCEQRRDRQPTNPTTLTEELKYNPFLRTTDAEFVKGLPCVTPEDRDSIKDSVPWKLRVKCLGYLRARKDARQSGEGFSFVYLAEEAGAPRGRRKWALKRIDCHSAPDEKRAKDEINLHERLASCSRILPLETYAFVEKRQTAVKQAILVLPYYKRGSLANELSTRFASKEQLPEERIFQIFIDVCTAVQACHKLEPEPFAHRDIKPGNVLLSIDDRAVLMDLGSARSARVSVANSREAQAFQDYAAEHCSMPYRAPELFNVDSGAEFTESTDMWSLGCLLYALCFFKSPYDIIYERGDSIALAAQSGRIFIPEDSGYSKFLLDLIRLLMQVNPSDRPDIDTVLWQLESINTTMTATVKLGRIV